MLFLESHETRSHAIGNRVLRDLGDALLLHAPHDRDPFFNRVGAIRWPDGQDAFDRRLAEILALFAGLDRRPHFWTPPAYRAPVDIDRRLEEHGFDDLGGAHVMLAVRPAEPTDSPNTTRVERLHGGPGATLPDDLRREIGWCLAEAFAVEREAREAIELDLAAAIESPHVRFVLIREGSRLVAVGRRFSADGASYLSSIGTEPLARGRGHAALVTRTLTEDAREEGDDHVYLAVHAGNDRAIDVYRRSGFEMIGDRAGDYLLF